MSEYKPGDIVDITIKGVRALRETVTEEGFRFLDFTHGRFNDLTHVALDDPSVTVTRVAPAEWPPQPGDLWPGDLWRDKHGELWFFHKNPYVTQPEPELMGRTTGGARWTDDVRGLVTDNAPLTLVHREQQDGGEQA